MRVTVRGRTDDGQKVFEFHMNYTEKKKLIFWPSGLGIKKAIQEFLDKIKAE